MSTTPVRGHRYHQLQVASALADAFLEGRMLDIGTGTGWLSKDRAEAVGLDIDVGHWRLPSRRVVAGTTDCLPFAPASFDSVALLASLGAYPPSRTPELLREVARVLTSGGRVLVLASNRRPIFDRTAIHRRVSPIPWHSFTRGELVGSAADAGLVLEHEDARGGVTTVLAEWFHHLSSPLGRGPLSRLRTVLGELDAPSIRWTRGPKSRYLYLVFRKEH